MLRFWGSASLVVVSPCIPYVDIARVSSSGSYIEAFIITSKEVCVQGSGVGGLGFRGLVLRG